ncbi:hypothetical protein AVEN_26960-1 [Araneus ventricosus]|uniref:Uncharacterized protein n=1 Tax=Araneus ventricosus TaxID=182803 RepID=A0A4Y2SBZ0_ARAVE|nr:hypothetical protein AVEN_26960-1 [Araneus ventricosus]
MEIIVATLRCQEQHKQKETSGLFEASNSTNKKIRRDPSRPATAQTERYLGTLRGQRRKKLYTFWNFRWDPGLTRRRFRSVHSPSEFATRLTKKKTISDPQGMTAPSTDE